MAIDFPAAPALNDEYTYLGKTWKWDGEKWNPLSGAVSHSELSDLGVDSHTQYALADGTRGTFASPGHSHSYDPAGTAAALVDDLSGVTNTSQARTNLGLGTSATVNVAVSGDAASGEVVKGNDTRLTNSRTPTAHAASHGSGQADALTLSINQITNLASELAAKAPSTSPGFAGTPTAPTAAQGTNTTQIATTAYVLANASNSIPVALINTVGSAGSQSTFSRSDHEHGYSTSNIATTSTTQTISGAKTFTNSVVFNSNATFSGNSPTISHSSSTAALIITASASQYGGIGLQRAGSNRWWIFANNTVESGSNVGSDLGVYAYADTNALIGQPLFIKRSTGTITFEKFVATEPWIKHGATGPGVYGTFAVPEGFITAPVGSFFHDLNETTGARIWKKVSGTGNTGWKVLDGDTGWRNLGALANDWTGSVFVRRINDTVEMYFDAITPPATWVSDVFYNGGIAAGFQPDRPAAAGLVKIVDTWTKLSSSTTKMLLSTTLSASSLAPESGTPDNTWGSFSGQVSWATSDTWPASLPGTAA
jgi:hypothetical protein